jgi:hypothetical protein
MLDLEVNGVSDHAIDLGSLSPAALDHALLYVLREMRERILNPPTYPATETTEQLSALARRAAQRSAVADLRRLLPGWGIRGREGELYEACTLPGRDMTIVINPVDAVRWYGQLLADPQSKRYDVHCMLTVCIDGEVVGAYLVNVYDLELLWAQPGSRVLRRTIYGYDGDTAFAGVIAGRGGGGSALSISGEPESHPVFMQLMEQYPDIGRLFTTTHSCYGGIASRLLSASNGFHAGVLRSTNAETVWEDGLLGVFCAALQMRVFEVRPDGLHEVAPLAPPLADVVTEYDLLYVHHGLVSGLAMTGLPITPLL